MKKVSFKMWIYAIGFLAKAILFNVVLVFAIIALIHVQEGYTVWANISVILALLWVFQNFLSHFIWLSLSRKERALYFGIRRHGHEVVKVTEKEVNSKMGQRDIMELFRDTDSSLEIQMAINGTMTLINVFVGIKWIKNAILFNKNLYIFEYEIVENKKPK